MIRRELSTPRRHECSGGGTGGWTDIKTVTIKGIIDMAGDEYPLYTYRSPENIINDIRMLWENSYFVETAVACNFKLVTTSGTRTESHLSVVYGGFAGYYPSISIEDGRLSKVAFAFVFFR